MQNRVTVTVGGLKYTLLTTEGEDYVHRVADYVNDKLKETTGQGGREIASGLHKSRSGWLDNKIENSYNGNPHGI